MGKTVVVNGLEIGRGIPKICVPIVETNKYAVIQAVMKAASAGAELVELRADWLEEIKDRVYLMELLEEIKKKINIPLIFTLRTSSEGGRIEVTEAEYEIINKTAIDTGCIDIIDVEIFRDMTAGEKIIDYAHKSGILVIGSNHDFSSTPIKNEIVRRLTTMQRAGADIVKIATMPINRNDIKAITDSALEMKSSYYETPVIVIAMGEIGLITRVSGEYIGSAVTFATNGKTSAPGQIEIQELRLLLNAIHYFSIKLPNIYLIGFMGTGKSAVANEMNMLTGLNVLEADFEIEKKSGMRISDIFKKYGEEYFRDMETELLEELSTKTGLIVSCGGGMPMKDENIRLMKNSGNLILLTAKPETIFERVRYSNDRPLLKGNMNVTYIKSLMEKRQERYLSVADRIVETDGKTPSEICLDIVKRYYKSES